ncbi:MAG: TonB-dependent receptor [Gammaproteobacteria bacterium]
MVSHNPHFAFFRGRSLNLVGIAVACTLAAQGVRAQAADSTSKEDDEPKETVVITANGSQVELPEDYAGGQIARGGRVGLFGNLDFMDTPFNATNYTADFMRNLQARSVADVVQSDPGVRVARGFGNFQELYVVRGFPVASDDMSYNGLYSLLPRQYVAAEFLERVEVMRGANSFVNGAAPNGSGVGGAFNLVPKRAPRNDLTRFTVGYENEGLGLVAADVARRFGDEDQFGVRVNGVRRDGTDSVDDEKRELSVGSLGVDYAGTRARFSADLGWQEFRVDAPRPSVTPFSTIPSAPDASSNFAQPWTLTSERDKFGVARGEFDFTEKTKLWAAAGLRDSTEHNILSNPSSDPAGVTSSYRFDNYREDLVTTGEIGVRGEFDTGPVKHRVSTQGSVFKLDSKNAYGFSNFGGFPNDLYNPVGVAPPVANFFTGGILFSPLTTTKTQTQSIALADTLSFNKDRVLLTLGARLQKLEQHTYDYNTGAENCRAVGTGQACGYDESVTTPVVGLVYKPTPHYSLYANYAEGLIPGDIAPPSSGGVIVSNPGVALSPFKSKQGEVGAKYDSGSFGMTASIFRVTKPTAIIDGTVFRSDGEQRNEGIELGWFGEPMKGLRVLGGVTLLRAENTKTQGGLADGTDVIGVPHTTANIGAEWEVPSLHALSFDGRVVYTSSQTANAADTVSLDSWTRLDVGARFAAHMMDKEITFRARVDNVTDKNYWASVGGSYNANYLVLGGPRTFALSASIDL